MLRWYLKQTSSPEYSDLLTAKQRITLSVRIDLLMYHSMPSIENWSIVEGPLIVGLPSTSVALTSEMQTTYEGFFLSDDNNGHVISKAIFTHVKWIFFISVMVILHRKQSTMV